jgi:hypothetical protein
MVKIREKTENIFNELISAWRKAEKDLLIEIEAPFVLTDENGREIYYGLLVKGFGGKLGTLILSTDDTTNLKEAVKQGYFCSALNPDTYSVYNRKDFIDALNDWGYFGNESEKPEWYSGIPWSRQK